MKGASELADLRARLDLLDDEVTVLSSVLEDLRNGDLALPGTPPPAARPAPPVTRGLSSPAAQPSLTTADSSGQCNTLVEVMIVLTTGGMWWLVR